MDLQNTPQRSSLANRVWHFPAENDGKAAALLSDRLRVTPVLGRILAARGMDNPDEARRFLEPSQEQLFPPFLMQDMEQAVSRIIAAVEGYEKILVVGDYDMDGTAAATIFFNYLRRLGARVHYFIPNRLADGYGLNLSNVAKYIQWEVDLVITADHGSTDVEGAKVLAREGVDLIITDHHQLGWEKPACAALVNPQQKDCPYPFKDLAAAGVAYKVIEALDETLTAKNFWDVRGIRRTNPGYYLDLVAMATVADMSPLVGENRVLVRLGLEMINSQPRPGLSGLIRECRVRGDVSPTTISFKLAPKINALGRIGDPGLAVQLLNSHSFTEARRLARVLVSTNQQRKVIEREVYELAMEQVGQSENDPGCVVVGGSWHPGVMGSIATRVAFTLHKPTVVLTLQDKPKAVGSARGWNGFNVLAALGACESLLDRFGGHPAAAGLSLQASDLDAFTRDFQEAVERAQGCVPDRGGDPLRIDTWVGSECITEEFIQEMSHMSPFGYCNAEPVLAMRGVRMENPTVFLKRHLKFQLLAEGGTPWEAVAWERVHWKFDDASRYDVAFMPQRHEGPKGAYTQLKVLDCIPSS